MKTLNDIIEPSHGFYKVCDNIFFNKLKAFENSFSIGHYPHWNYHDEYFSKVPWHIEPTESLDQLYKERAEHLRNQYDYIVLSYSGGIDSYNAAESFVKNDIHLDVLFNRGEKAAWTNAYDTSAKNLNLEALLVAYPQFQKLKDAQPDLRFHRSEWGNSILDYWSNETIYVDDYNWFSANLVAKKYIYKEFPEAEKYNNPAFLIGTDKPQLYKIDGKYFVTFVDERITSHIMHEITADPNNPFRVVSYYWDPAAEKLMRKQVHAIIRWFESHPEFEYLLNFPHRSAAGKPINKKINMYDEIIKGIVYTQWDPTIWQAEKNGFTFYLPEEQWFRKLNERLSVQKWKKINDEYSNKVHEIFNSRGKLNQCKQDAGGNWQPPVCFSKMHQIF